MVLGAPYRTRHIYTLNLENYTIILSIIMNLISSLKSCRQVLKDDREFQSIGFPKNWYTRFHYRGRWESRFLKTYKVDLIEAKILNQKVQFPLSFPYSGMAKGILLDQEYLVHNVLTKQPKRILDLGANIGLGALFFKCQFPEAEFICVEPDSRNLPLLEKTISLNDISAQVLPCAVGSKAGTLKLRFGDDPTCSALETSPIHDLQENIIVLVQTIPEILSLSNWHEIDLLKIDIEGAEDELLSTNNEWLNQVKNIILEIHPNTTPEKIASYIKPYGFTLTEFSQGREPVYLARKSG